MSDNRPNPPATPKPASKPAPLSDVIQMERFIKTFDAPADWKDTLTKDTSGPTYMMTEYRDSDGHIVAVGTAKGKEPLYQSNFGADKETVAKAIADIRKLPHVKGIVESENNQYIDATGHGLNPIDAAVAATKAKGQKR